MRLCLRHVMIRFLPPRRHAMLFSLLQTMMLMPLSPPDFRLRYAYAICARYAADARRSMLRAMMLIKCQTLRHARCTRYDAAVIAVMPTPPPRHYHTSPRLPPIIADALLLPTPLRLRPPTLRATRRRYHCRLTSLSLSQRCLSPRLSPFRLILIDGFRY